MAEEKRSLRFLQRPYLNSIGLLADEPGWKAKAHFHTQMTELQLFVHGSGQVYVDGQTYPVAAGDLAVFSSNLIHYDDLSSCRENVVSYFLRFQEYQIQGMEPNQFLRPGASPVLHTGAYEAEFRFFFECIYAECERQAAQNESICENYLMAILYLTHRILAQREGCASDGSIAEPAKNAVLIMKEAIDRGFTGEMDLDRIARQTGYAAGNLARQFREELGVTPSQYLMRIRISEAKRLLANSDMTLAKIAQIAGFHTAAYFSAQFKRTVGLTPGRYRQAHMGLSDHNCV